MKPTISVLLAIAVPAFFFLSCKNEPKQKPESTAPKVDTIQVKPVSKEGASTYIMSEGTVNWSGKKNMGDTHNGTLAIESGELLVNDGRIISGKFSLDMNSISVLDIKDAGERRDLESHLKDKDFFETGKYPKAEFVTTEILPSNNPAFNWLAVGNLTMKGKTNAVNIPLKVTVDGAKIAVETPAFPIQRTLWGVNFRSGILGTAKDKLIDDNILLSLTLQAKKQ
jgi:hypothetical protein